MPSNVFGAKLTNKAGTGPAPQVYTATVIAKNGDLTAAAIAGGVCRVVTAGAGSSTNPTVSAAAIITALKLNQGDTFQFTCVPNDVSNTITVTDGGTGVTLAAGQLNVTVAGTSITYSGLVTGAATITLSRIA